MKMRIIINESVTTIDATAEELAASNGVADSFANALRRAFNRVCLCEETDWEDGADISS